MYANKLDAATAEAETLHVTPMELGPWGLTGKPTPPARHVVWGALALVVVTLCVLVFA
jgi:hypothetical protein